MLTTIVSLGVYYGLVFTIMNPDNPIQLQITNIISWITAVTFAYFTNKKFVFESRSTGKKQLSEMIKFYIARLSTLAMDMCIMFLGVTVLKYNDKIIKLIVQIIVTIANYIFSKLLVFRNRGDENELE